MTQHRKIALLALGVALLAPRADAASRAFVTCTDYGVSGTLSSLQDASPFPATNNAATIGSDAVPRFWGGLLYVVNRQGGDNIQVLDPAGNFQTVIQFTTGPGSNPQDIALASSTKAYVSRYESADVWIVNPQTGAHTGTISLAGFADADGIPEMSRMAVVGRRLFVALELLDRVNFFTPTGPGKVAVIDMDTDQLIDADPQAQGVQAITLSRANPTTQFQLDRSSGKLMIGETGNYGVNDGGVENIDPVSLSALGIVTTEDSLGGDILAISASVGPGGGCYGIIADPNFNTALVKFEEDGSRAQLVHQAAGFVLADVAQDDQNRLWLSDRTGQSPGMRVFDGTTGQPLAAAPISTGLPPNAVAFDVSLPTAVPGAGPRSGMTLRVDGSALFREDVRFEVRGVQGPARARIVNVSGRMVRDLGVIHTSQIRWDGLAASGGRAASGAYWLQVESDGRKAGVRVTKF